MKRVGKFLLYAAACGLFQIATAPNASATPLLASAGSFAVLAGSTVTNTGATTINGNIGLYPGTSYTGSGTVTQTGVKDINNLAAQTAQADALTAYNTLKALAPTLTIGTGVTNLSGTLGVGTYDIGGTTGAALLNSALTLDFAGATNENIVFQIASTLTTGSGSSVSIINAASGDNVYWQVGSSAILGTSTSFVGDIIALTSVTMDTTAKDGCGSVIALNGAVTMDTNTISTTCNVVNSSGTTIGTFGSGGTNTNTVVSGGTGVGTVSPVPEPSTLLLLCTGIAGLAARRPRWTRGRRLDLAPKA